MTRIVNLHACVGRIALRCALVLLVALVAGACGGGNPPTHPVTRCDHFAPECDAAESLACLDPCRAWMDIAVLASPAFGGRGTETIGNEAAAQLIADRFAALGLEQAPGLGGWRQVFPAPLGGLSPVPVPNVLGVIPGSDPALRHEVVLIGAHLDHLGTRGGVIYPGAYDDASGVAIVLELARAFAKSTTPPRRTLVFAAWNGEEVALLGSCFYANADPRFPLADTVAAFAVDGVGVGDTDGVHVFGTTTDPTPAVVRVMCNATAAAELDHFIRGPFTFDLSDHACLSRRGVPSVMVASAGPHSSLHTSQDTVEKIEPEALRTTLELLFVTVQAFAQGSDSSAPCALTAAAPRDPGDHGT